MKIQVHSSLKPALEYNQYKMPLTNQDYLWPFQPTLEIHEYYTVTD